MNKKSEAINLLPQLNIDVEDISNYLNMDYDIFAAMSPEELSEIVWKLKRYSLYLKCEYNKYNSRARWLYTTINKMCKPRAKEYNCYDKDERLYSAIGESPKAKSFLDLKIENEQESSLIEGIDSSVKYMISMLEGLYFYKLERKKNDSARED